MAGALSGGDKLMAYLDTISRGLASAGTGPEVRVGFLEGSGLEPGGAPTPLIAAIQEFGGTIHRDAGTVTVYRKVSAKGTHFLRNGRFVKRREANFSSTHATPAYSATIPPRPYFRNMIKKYAPTWGAVMSTMLKSADFDARKTLNQMGQLISGQLRQSIVDTNSPPLAASTIAAKSRGKVVAMRGVLGPAKPLVDTGHMLNSISHEVST